MDFVAVVGLLAVVEYITIAMLTGRARGQYGVKAPATTGHPIFERWYRVQQNTLEQMIAFLPGLFLFASYVSARWASHPRAGLHRRTLRLRARLHRRSGEARPRVRAELHRHVGPRSWRFDRRRDCGVVSGCLVPHRRAFLLTLGQPTGKAGSRAPDSASPPTGEPRPSSTLTPVPTEKLDDNPTPEPTTTDTAGVEPPCATPSETFTLASIGRFLHVDITSLAV